MNRSAHLIPSVLDPKGLQKEFSYSVEVSLRYSGAEIEDWLVSNGMRHMVDWKALRMDHRGIYTLYFCDPHKAVMAKLRWGGQMN